MPAKAIGERGSWFAQVEGERLPCIHRHWLTGMNYCDQGYRPDEPKWDGFVKALKVGRKAILTNGTFQDGQPNGLGWTIDRTGYVAIFGVEDVESDETNLRMKLVSRLRDLR